MSRLTLTPPDTFNLRVEMNNIVVQGRPDSRTPEQVARETGREARRGMARTGG